MSSSYQMVARASGNDHDATERLRKQSAESHRPDEDIGEGSKSSGRPRVKYAHGPSTPWERLSKSMTDGWILEIASLASSIVLLVGLAILFLVFRGKSTLDWHGYLSFATIIAILSKAIQVTLMLPVTSSISQLGWIHFRKSRALIDFQLFDAASRGLWGNLYLLVAVPSFCAVLSAFIVIPALGLEAAAQQCLTTSATEYIPTLLTIFYLDQFGSSGGTVTDGIRNAGLSAMTAKHFQAGGDLSPSFRSEPVLPQTLVYSCTTAGCSPPPYVTLSFCSRCEDITEDLIVNPDWCNNNDNSNGTCGVYLPYGAALNTSDQALALSAAPIEYSSDQTWTGELLLANFTMVEQTSPVVSGTDQPVHYAAQSCSIVLCANIYQLNVSAGDTGASGATEVQLASLTKASWSAEPSDAPGGNWPGYTIIVPDQTALNLSNGKAAHWQGGTTVLGIDNTSTAFLGTYLTSLFTGVGAIPSPDQSYNLATTLKQAAESTQRPAGSGFWDTIVYTLWGYQFIDIDDFNTQIDTVLADITTSMGNWVRDLYPVQEGGETGQPGLDLARLLKHSSYQIRWAWLVLPVALEVLAFVLLTTTMELTSTSKVPVWKASTMATLFHGISHPEEAAGVSYQEVSFMEDEAAKRRVKLAVTAARHHLVDVQDDA